MSDIENQTTPAPSDVVAEDRKPRSRAAVKKASAAKTKKGKEEGKASVYCVCHGKDDGRPMIRCDAQCRNWYHLQCVNLTEDDAGDIALYVCPECKTKTGLETVMEWEGPEALEKIVHVDESHTNTMKSKTNSRKKQQLSIKKVEDVDAVHDANETALPPPKVETEDESEEGSADDYVDEHTSKRPKSTAGRLRPRRVSVSSDDSGIGSDKHDTHKGRDRRPAKRKHPSGTPEIKSKRRDSTAPSPTVKKAKVSDDKSSREDAVRKYCLGKLDEVIRPIFLEHATSMKADAEVGTSEGGGSETPAITLSDEEKATAENHASAFVAQLEECIFSMYQEPDKNGHPSAAGKYKERFRMLTFNLGKHDRVALRRGIASHSISPHDLSTMSSTDLANEQTQHEIQVAEKESLEHSILKKMTAPRAKITHKGLESIEDVNGTIQRESRDEIEEQMERERRERERMARLKAALQLQNVNAEAGPASAGGMPYSPTTTMHRPANSPTVMLQQHHGDQPSPHSPLISRPPARPLFIPSSTDLLSSVDEGLNLTDLINIDEDTPPRDMTAGAEMSPPSADNMPVLSESVVSVASPTPELSTPSGPSPFAPSSAQLPGPESANFKTAIAFDLNALWTDPSGAKNAEAVEVKKDEDTVVQRSPVPELEEPVTVAMDVDDLGDDMQIAEADDNDFDALLLNDEQVKDTEVVVPLVPTPAVHEPTLNDLPQVWDGIIAMPLEALLTPSVHAVQIGGKSLEPDSPVWKILFPTSEARIDGRVPVDRSSQYLLTNCMNSAKALVAVYFRPTTELEASKLQDLLMYLVDKNRHGLVFPWGHHPPPHAPGKELYLIPLRRDAPIPDCIEMLDDLKLPQQRTSDMLLGIFVLAKEKLVVPASTTPPLAQAPNVAAPVPQAAAPPSFTIPTFSSSVPATTPITQVASSLKPAPLPSVDAASLAAEVASLTPSQITSLLQQLTATTVPNPTPPIPQLPILSTNLFVPPTPVQYPMAQPTMPPQPLYPPYTGYGITPTYQQPPPPMAPPQAGPSQPNLYGYRPPPPIPPAFDNYNHSPPPITGRQNSFEAEDRRGGWNNGGGPPRGGGGGDRSEKGGKRRSGRSGRNRDRHKGPPLEERPRDSGWGGRGRGRGAAP